MCPGRHDAANSFGENQPTASLWYRDAVIYELHVRSFYDSNGDGIGDFPGLTEKLDYLQDLGITAIWLLPHYPSPLKDGGYDIADYKKVHPDYGTLGDFKTFVREAHRRGLKVITELVLNHTSDQHPWFQRAERAEPGAAGAQLLRLERHARRGTATRASSSGISSHPTGHGTRRPAPTTGTASTPISPT